MADRRNPTFGSTDWAAKKFLRTLEREERQKAARRSDVQIAQPQAGGDSGVEPAGLPYGALPQPGDRYNVPAAERQAFRDELESRGGLSPSMRSVFDYIFEFEGGNKVNPANGATAGITGNMLGNYLRQLYDANPEIARHEGRRMYEPRDLIGRPQMQIAFMKWLANNQMGRFDIDQVATPREAGRVGDPKLALQLYDTLYHYGMSEGSQVIQKGLNEVLADRREGLMASGMSPQDAVQVVPPIQIPKEASKRNIGVQTMGAIRELLDVGFGEAVRDAINRNVEKAWSSVGNKNEARRRFVYR